MKVIKNADQPYWIEQDPDYDWRPAIPEPAPQPKGIQCGQCGMKFDYGKAYGFCCQHPRCPCGYGPSTSMAGAYP